MSNTKSDKLACETAGPSNLQEAPTTSNIQPSFPFLKTRMSPSALLHFINSDLSEMQKSAIREMGFGGLLCLKTDMIPGQLAYWLVSNFNPFMSSLLDNQLPIRDLDVHLTTGLPMGEIEIKQATKYEQSDMYLDLVRAWKSQYDGIVKVNTSHIFNRMSYQRDGGDDFKRNFIVVVVSTFLMGVKGIYPSLRILKCLADVSVIPKLKWCDFTQKNITNSVVTWRADKAKQTEGYPEKVYKGPIMVLILIYLDRVVFMGRTVDRVFPTLCTWTKQAISARVSKEKKEARCFGAGFVDAYLDKNGCIVGSGYVESQPTGDAVVHDVINDGNHGAPANEDRDGHIADQTSVSACIEKIADAGKVLAHAFEYFAKTIHGAKSVMPNSVVVGQLSDLADAFQGSFTLTPPTKPEDGGLTKANCHTSAPDAGLAGASGSLSGVQVGADTVRRSVRRSVRSSSSSETGGVCVTATAGTDDDPCWSDPTFLAAVFALSSAFNKEPDMQPAAKKQRVAPEHPSFNLFDSQEHFGTACATEHPTVVVDPHPLPPANDVPINLNILAPKDTKPHRDKIVSEVFKSPFVQRNISMLSELSQSERDVSDLVFRDGLDESEVLFRNQHFQLRRCDIKSLITNPRVATNLVNAWAHILNKQEELKSASSPLRHYAFVTPNGIVCKDNTDYNNLKLMFFPFTFSVPFLICVNFITRKIEVIHSMRPQTVDFTESVRVVRDFIRREMTVKSRRFLAVQFFRCEEFVPKTYAIDNVDDGIYLMCYMETYAGCRQTLKSQVVNSRPDSAVDKILFKQKMKYCFAILTCTHNDLSDHILTDAKRLNIKSGKQAVVQEVRYSDTHLLDYVFRPSEGDATSDIVVDTTFGQATKAGMNSLRPRAWITDMVIDMYGIYSTIQSPDLLYIPSIAHTLDPKRDKNLGRNYIKTTYMPKDGTGVKAMFIPIIDKDHWLLCVCDLEMKHNFILNSLRKKDPQADTELAADVVSNVVQILCRSKGYKHFVGVPLADFTILPVPQQTNTFDCGVYVLKWLESGRDRSKWESKSNFKALAAFRKTVALNLLRWSENKRKIF